MLIRLDNLDKSYRMGSESIPVLKRISLEVAKGTFMAIMGPSGSGKSTLLNILGCLDRVSSGTYFLDDMPVHASDQAQLARLRNRSIGFVFQNFNLLPRLTVEQNVELPLIYASLPRRIRSAMVKDILGRMGLWERRTHRPHEISGGQKQRVAIARALVKNPDFILADEPTGNLDSATTRSILDLFHDLHRSGNTILMITHEREVAREAQRACSLQDGVLSEGC